MRTVAAGESATISRRVSTDWIRVQVEDSTGAMQDRTSFVKAIEYEQPKADGPIAQATVTFSRKDGSGNSLAPLMTSNPPLEEGRTIALAIDAGAGVWKEQYRGRIEGLDWRGRWENEVVAECSDQSGELRDTFIEKERTYGSDAGVAMETVMQALYADNAETPPTLHVPVATDAVVTPAFKQEQTGLYDAARALSDAIGWVHWWRNFDANTSDWKLTLFEPARTSTTSQRTFGVSDYYDVSEMNTGLVDIRNAVQVFYRDANGVEQKTAILEDAASIEKYGRRYMAIIEGEGSPINTDALATTLGNAALSDLKEPTATLEVVGPYFWPGEIGVDRYTFTANGIHFSADQTLAATTIRHSLVVGQRPETRIQTRGQPTGGVNIWKAKAQRPKPGDRPESMLVTEPQWRDSADGLSEIGDWTNGAKVEEIWIAERTVEGQVTAADWSALRDSEESKGLITSYTVKKPSEADGIARVTLLRIVGTYTDPATGDLVNSDAWTRTIRPKTAIAAIDPETGELVDGSVVAAKLVAGAQRYASDVVFSASDSNTVAWAAGTLRLADGTAYSIGAGNTGDMAGGTTHYIYFDPAQSTTALRVTSTYSDVAGNTRLLVCVAQPVADAAQRAAYFPGVGVLSLNGDNIQPSSVTTNHLQANTVTAAKIEALILELGKYIRSNSYSAGSSGWNIAAEGDAEFNDVTVRGTLTADTVASDGANKKLIPKGVKSGTITNTGTVTFEAPYNSAPLVIFSGGAAWEDRAKWGTKAQADDGTAGTTRPSDVMIAQAVGADVTTTGFTAYLRLVAKGSTTAKSASFASPTSVTAVGSSTGNATPADADTPSVDDRYKATYTVNIDNTGGGTEDIVDVEVALDVSLDGGAWSEVASQWTTVFAAAGATGSATDSLTATVTSVDGGNDNFRLRVKSVKEGITATFTSLTVAANALTWSVDSGALYASMTPNGTADAVQYFVVARG